MHLLSPSSRLYEVIGELGFFFRMNLVVINGKMRLASSHRIDIHGGIYIYIYIYIFLYIVFVLPSIKRGQTSEYMYRRRETAK